MTLLRADVKKDSTCEQEPKLKSVTKGACESTIKLSRITNQQEE